MYMIQTNRVLVSLRGLLAAWFIISTVMTTFPVEAAKKKSELSSIEFTEAKVINAIRIISELSGANIVATEEAGKKTASLYLKNVSVRQALDSLSRVSGLWYRYNKASKTYLVMTVEEYNNDLVVYNQDLTRVFTLLHQNVVATANIIRGLFGGDRVILDTDTEDNQALGTAGQGARTLQGQNSTTTITTRGLTSNENSNDVVTERPKFDLSQAQIKDLGLKGDGTPVITGAELNRYIKQEPKIYATVNREHNLLFIRTSDEQAMKQIERIVIESDRPTPQVLLEMKILEFEVGDNYRSMVDLSFQFGKGSKTINDSGVVTQNPLFGTQLGRFPLEGGTALFQIFHDKIQAAVELAEQESELKVLATPMLLASNNRASRLFIGEERIITTGFETNTTTGTTGASNTVFNLETERRDVGNTLNIVPRINSDRTVTLLIQQDNSTVNVGATNLSAVSGNGNVVQIPVDTVNSANIESTIIAKDGLTVAIGGMIRQRTELDDNKVPLLGDIPYLGNLFKRKVDDEQRTELILLVTPHILTTPEEAEKVSKDRLRALSLLPELEENLNNSSKKEPTSVTTAETSDLIYLTRYAAKNIRKEPIEDSKIVPISVGLKTPVRLIEGRNIDMMPIQAWRRNDLYLTVLVTRNLGKKEEVIDESELEGAWLAATMEHRSLGPKGSTYANGYMYLVSDRPFLDVLSLSPVYQAKQRIRTGS